MEPNIAAPFLIAFRPPRRSGFHNRPEFGALKEWYEAERTGGVCALIGTFGSGKSALLNELIDHLESKKRSTPYAAVPAFVYSFDLGLSPQDCFRKLVRFIREDVRRALGLSTIATSEEQRLDRAFLLEVLQSDLPCSINIILDAVEKASDEFEALDGRLVSEELNALLTDSVRGNLDKVTWFVSSRYEPKDLAFQASQHLVNVKSSTGNQSNFARYNPINIGALPLETCEKILSQDYAIRAPSDVLNKLCKRCGCHAITMQLMGSYIKNFCDGDANRVTQLDIFVGHDLIAETPSQRMSLEYYTAIRNLHRDIVINYCRAMKLKDPLALELLELVCLFRKGSSTQTLTRLFIIPHKSLELSSHKGNPTQLQKTSLEELTSKLMWLSDLGLLQFIDAVASVHVAIRSHVSSMMNPLRREFAYRIICIDLIASQPYIHNAVDDVQYPVPGTKNAIAISPTTLSKMPSDAAERMRELVG